jgi:hypothetical protein
MLRKKIAPQINADKNRSENRKSFSHCINSNLRLSAFICGSIRFVYVHVPKVFDARHLLKGVTFDAGIDGESTLF